MNRILIVALLIATAAACAPAPTNTVNVATTNTNTAPAATPAAVTEADALAREKQLWDALKAKNYDSFGALLADDQIYVSSDGVHDKASTLKGVTTFELTDYTLSDVKLVNVDKDVHVLAYKASVKGTSEGKPIPPDASEYSSSVWVNRAGKWLAIYHQESMAKPMPTPSASPAAAASPATAASPAAAASPAGSPSVAATATDAEKQIWDALKRKDWNAFAAMLAPESIEVWHSGISTRAQSIEGVKQVEFARATISDFKEVKLTPTASLVTYVSKSPDKGWNPAGERHTSLWVNRGGKWLAYFHQGTDIEK